jgi:hypothetical protein
MTDKTITLSRPITTHEGQVSTITVREPKGKDFFELGDPTTLVRTQHGLAEIRNDGVIEAYINRCVSVEAALLANQLNLRDAMAVRDAVLDFFREEPATP